MSDIPRHFLIATALGTLLVQASSLQNAAEVYEELYPDVSIDYIVELDEEDEDDDNDPW